MGAFNKGETGASLILKTYTAHPKVVSVCFVSISFMRGSLRRSAFLFPFPARPRSRKKYGYRPIPKIPSGLCRGPILLFIFSRRLQTNVFSVSLYRN